MHFFIDPEALPTNIQEEEDSYGPLTTDPNNIYKLTTEFILDDTLSEHRAFACLSGFMIVQQSDYDSELVNIILKPSGEINIPFNNVLYFVYRGIKKSSFLESDEIIPGGVTGNSEFINRVWADLDKQKLKEPSAPDPTPLSIGYDNSIPAATPLTDIFWKKLDARSIFVNEGEWIGSFYQDNGTPLKIGFEIVLESSIGKTIFDFSYIRQRNSRIEITGLTGLELKFESDKILGFIDPAAFFGLYYYSDLYYSIYIGLEKTTIISSANLIYEDLLAKFYTKNRVYLDIRSEKGFSYNYYDNYHNISDFNLKLGNSTITPVELIYGNNGWPIIVIDDIIETDSDFNDLKINLRVDDNINPIVFFQNEKIKGTSNINHFIQPFELLNGIDTEWTFDIDLYFPNDIAGPTRKNLAYYIKLYYFRKSFNTESPSSVPKYEQYFNDIFCPISLPYVGDIYNPERNIVNPEFTYARGTVPGAVQTFDYVGKSGIYWDETKVVFYSKAKFVNTVSNLKLGYVPTLAINPGLNLSGVPKDAVIQKNISVRSFERDIDLVGNADLLSIFQYSSQISNQENFFMFAITHEEFLDVIAVSGLSIYHLKNIYLEELEPTPKTDNNNRIYREYSIKVIGLDDSIVSQIKNLFSGISVYSLEGFCFNTVNFGEILSLNNRDQISNIFGGIKVNEWSGWADDSREANVVDLIEELAPLYLPVTPSFFYTIAIGEGFNLWIDAHYDPVSPHNVMINQGIDGFQYLGVDNFTSEFDRYQPYLPNTFNQGDEFDEIQYTNEWNEIVRSATFKDLESGLLGFGSVLKQRRDKFLEDLDELNLRTPTEDELAFWNYVYYQGEGRAKNYLEKTGLEYDKPANPSSMNVVRNKALARLAIWKYIQTKQFFSK